MKAASRAMDHGLIVNAVRPGAVRLAPPLTITSNEVSEAIWEVVLKPARWSGASGCEAAPRSDANTIFGWPDRDSVARQSGNARQMSETGHLSDDARREWGSRPNGRLGR